MGQFLIVSKADRLADYCQIAQSYQVGFEYNDFYDPVVLSDEERLDGIWQQYDACGKPSICTMHGAFLDVTVFSADPKIRICRFIWKICLMTIRICFGCFPNV